MAEEKLAIASKYLIPQIEELTGLNSDHVTLSESALNTLNKSYCRESGVRNLRKHIEKIYRKVAFKVGNCVDVVRWRIMMFGVVRLFTTRRPTSR